MMYLAENLVALMHIRNLNNLLSQLQDHFV